MAQNQDRHATSQNPKTRIADASQPQSDDEGARAALNKRYTPLSDAGLVGPWRPSTSNIVSDYKHGKNDSGNILPCSSVSKEYRNVSSVFLAAPNFPPRGLHR